MSYTPPPPPPGQGDSGAEQPPGFGYGAPGPGGPGGPASNNTKAVASLIIGIVSLPIAFCCSIFGLVSIAAIVLGRMAKNEIAASGGTQSGAGIAQAGFVLGIVGAVLSVVMFIVSIAIFSSGNFDFTPYTG